MLGLTLWWGRGTLIARAEPCQEIRDQALKAFAESWWWHWFAALDSKPLEDGLS